MSKRIGSKKNFMVESQQNDLEHNDKLVNLNQNEHGGVTVTELILEPTKFDSLGSECRLTFDEYCETVNTVIESEEADWSDLRMKDQINITRDAIMEATVLKYAKQSYDIDPTKFNGRELSYTKRYDSNGRFIGEAVIIRMTK